MAHLRPQFEKEIRHRIQLKSQAHVSEEQVLLTSFKYYDLDNTGTLTLKQFNQVMQKIGFQIFDQNNMRDMFLYYTGGADRLDYKEFGNQIFHSNSVLSRRFSPNRDRPITGNIYDIKHPEEILIKLKVRIQQQGPNCLLRMAEWFMVSDVKNTRLINLQQFRGCIENTGIKFPSDDLILLFNYFDRHQQKSIQYDELLTALRGPILFNDSLRREYNKLSLGQKYIEVKVLVDVFEQSSQQHKKKDEILDNFLQNLKIYLKLRDIKKNRFTQEQFDEFNVLTHFDISQQQLFDRLMSETWNPSEQWKVQRSINFQQVLQPIDYASESKQQKIEYSCTPIKKLDFDQNSLVSSSNDSNKIDYFPTMARIRAQLKKRGPKAFIALQKQLIRMNEHDKDQISQANFVQIIKNYKIDLTPQEAKEIFIQLDTRRLGSISIQNFMLDLLGPHDPENIDLTNQIFDLLDTDSDQVIQINHLKTVFNAKYHPDVRKGLRSESEILAEFLDSYEELHSIFSSNREQNIQRKEFMYYYYIMGIICETNSNFESMMKGCYKQILPQIDNNKTQMIQSQMLKSYVQTTAPFGTCDDVLDYTLSSRGFRNQKQQVIQKSQKSAGVTSWPGQDNQVWLIKNISEIKDQQ